MWTMASERENGLHARIERVLTARSRSVLRLGAAGTSVTFVIVHPEGDESHITLLLDREPPVLADGQDAEVMIELDEAGAREFARGRLIMSNHLLEGHGRCRGPVRKYLAVDPILRGLLARLEADHQDGGGL